MAREGGFDYFTTTLSISPLKNAEKLNEIGEELGRNYQVKPICLRILKRRMAISGLWSFRSSMDCIVRTTAAVCFPKKSGRRGPRRELWERRKRIAFDQGLDSH